jgi:hypothetical protein
MVTTLSEGCVGFELDPVVDELHATSAISKATVASLPTFDGAALGPGTRRLILDLIRKGFHRRQALAPSQWP